MHVMRNIITHHVLGHVPYVTLRVMFIRNTLYRMLTTGQTTLMLYFDVLVLSLLELLSEISHRQLEK